MTAVGSLAVFSGCNKGVPVGDYSGAGDLNEPYFQTDRVELGVNENYVAVFSETENVVWSSDDETVATVSQSGEITAVAQGSTFIKATFDGTDYKCLVVVKDSNSFISLAFDKTRIDNLLLGAKATIETSLSYQGLADLTLEWSSSNEQVVAVTAYSNDGCEIEAVGNGSAVVTAKYENRVSAVCYVTVNANQPQVFQGEIERPNGFENVTVSKTDFNAITTDTSVSAQDTEGKVELLDGAFFEDADDDGKREIVAFATLNGFDGYAIDSTFESRFAYGVLLNVFETDDAHQAYYLKNQKIYSTAEADENGNFAVMLDDVPDGVYAVQAFVEYSDGGEVVIYESQTSKLLSADANANKFSAIKGAEDLVGRVYYGWSANAYNFGDSGGYSAAYLKTEKPTATIGGKLPTVSYGWETDQIALATRLGVKTSIDKDGLIGYKKYGGITTMYFEIYMQYSSTYQRPVKKLVGVNSDGSGIYAFIHLNTNQWHTLEYDIDFLIEHYDVIFNADNTATGGLVLLATPNLKETVNDPSATNNQNVYYIGDVFIANSERYNQEKYGGVEKISAVDGTEKLVARIYDGWSAKLYDFSNAGDYSRLYLDAETPTEAVDGKLPQVAYSWEEQQYYAIRFGVQTTVTKDELVKYKQYSGLTTLAFELYMAHSQYTYERSMKKLVGVNADGTGVYKAVKLKTNQWNTLTYDIGLLIEYYDVIFNAANTATGGLALLVTPNLGENGKNFPSMDWENTYYVGEVFFGKDVKDDGVDAQYTVTLRLGMKSATVEPSALTVAYGEEYALPTPTCTGYKFVGWKTADGKTFEINGVYALCADVELIAEWVIDEESSENWTEGI